MTARAVYVCSCGEVMSNPAGMDETGRPLCLACQLEHDMATAPDWPPRDGNAARGCMVGALLALVLWTPPALLCAVLIGGR